MLQPALDDHVLCARSHARHLEDLFGSVVRPLELVEAAKSQPNHSAVLIQREVAAILYSLKGGLLLLLQLNHLIAVQ